MVPILMDSVSREISQVICLERVGCTVGGVMEKMM